MEKRKRIAQVLYNVLFRNLPISYGSLGSLAKTCRYRCARLFASGIGKNVNIEKGAVFSPDIVIGDNSGLGVNAVIPEKVTIGKNVMMGEDCLIITRNHSFSQIDIPMINQGFQPYYPVIIEDDVWIGSRVTILPGIKIGEGSIIGAGSVVTRDVEPYSIIGGNPAKLIRLRK